MLPSQDCQLFAILINVNQWYSLKFSQFKKYKSYKKSAHNAKMIYKTALNKAADLFRLN